MSNNDSRINQILSYLAKAASTAADGMSDVVQQAGSAVGDRYSVFKLKMDLTRLNGEQEKVFRDIGHTMFMVKNGAFEAGTTEDGEKIDDQETVDKLLGLAEDKQKEIDEISDRIKDLNGDVICPVCGKVARDGDVYCSACGTKLPKVAPPAEEETEEAEDESDDK